MAEVEVRVWNAAPDTWEWVYGKVVDFTAERTIVVRLRPDAGGPANMQIVTVPNQIRRFVMPSDLDDIEAFLSQRPVTSEELEL